ncbi:MAG: prolyl oligopeptidase family serine peptidase [Acidobacteria bacterium]|nr:prolyl oligopeptidase family serine peptidase [Acidobacteriota bacterium]
MSRPIFLAALLLAAPVVGETPVGLINLSDNTVYASPERNWTRLGIATWDLRRLERVERGDGIEAWHVGYKSDDQNITGYLAQPYIEYDEFGKPKQLFPAVILCHGSGQGVSPAYREVAKAFARRGYVVAASSYRGHRGLEGRSEGSRQYAKGETLDVFQMIQLVRKLDYVDSQRMAIWGQGEGGLIAAQVIGRSNVFKAAVLDSPVLISGSPDYGFAGLRRYATIAEGLLGRQLSETELVRQMMDRDAFRFAPKITTPVLLIAPENDPGAAELNLWAKVLGSKGIEHRVLRYPDMFFGFTTAVNNGTRPSTWMASRDNAWTNTFNWIETYAPPNPPEEETP